MSDQKIKNREALLSHGDAGAKAPGAGADGAGAAPTGCPEAAP